MSVDCIDYCPRIQECIKRVDSNLTKSAMWRWKMGSSDVDRLVASCRDSYNCPGPDQEIVVEEKRFKSLRERLKLPTSQQKVYVRCPLDETVSKR